MFTKILIVASFFVTVNASAQMRPNAMIPCHSGNIVVNTIDDFHKLQDQWCVDGSVIIHGIVNLGGDNVEQIILPRLKIVTGAFIVSHNDYLKIIWTPKFASALYVAINFNPMLQSCYANQSADRTQAPKETSMNIGTGDCARWVPSMGIGLMPAGR